MQRFRGLLEEYKQADNKRRRDMWLMFREIRVLFDEVEQRTAESSLLNLNEFFSSKCHIGRDKKGHDEVFELKNILQIKEPVCETPIPIQRRSPMADVTDYKTGKLLKLVKEVFKLLESFKGPLVGSKLGERILEEIRKLNPKLMKDEQASDLIQKARKCASGERVCRELHKETPSTGAIFLDELAEAMVEIGKARYVTKQEAIEILGKYRGNPLVVSAVSGKPMELCRTWPEKCLYWHLEKHGIRCVEKPDDH
ncbi:MAG: hypothetical protein FJ123_09040 [Deltaproteobacteria bacterium]|nr:hypothetical protein [Deltaproteobacteria bacterium]